MSFGYACSNASRKIMTFLRKKCVFHKNFFFHRKKTSTKNEVIQLEKKIFVSLLKKGSSIKTFYSVKKNHFVKKIILCKKHSVKNKFCFQFSFATNDQV